MTQNDLTALAQSALHTTILASSPMLGIGVLIGLIISIFQATTQINDQTLIFVPKILAVLFALLFFGGWIFDLLVDFTVTLFGQINQFVG